MFKLIVTLVRSNWLALLSIILSGAALWQSYDANRPKVQITYLPFSVWETHGEHHIYYGLIPLAISNTGGRAVSLKTLQKMGQSHLVRGVYNDGVRNEEFSFSFYTFDESYTKYDIMRDFSTISKLMPLTTEAYFVGKKIEPGDSVRIMIAVSTGFMDDDCLGLLISLEAQFSDGTVVPITAAIDAKVKRGTR